MFSTHEETSSTDVEVIRDSAADPGSPFTREIPINRGSPTGRGSSTERGNPTDQDSPTFREIHTDRGSPTDQGSLTDRGSPNERGRLTDRGSSTDWGGPTDRGDPTDRGNSTNQGESTNQGGSTEWGRPTDRGGPTDRGSLTEWGRRSERDRPARRRSTVIHQRLNSPPRWVVSAALQQSRPRISEESALRDNHEPTHQDSESRLSQSSDTDTPNDTYVTPFPQHYRHLSRLRQAQERHNRVAEISSGLQTTGQDIVGQIADREEMTGREEIPPEPSQESAVISSASEESNQSLPEYIVQVYTDTVGEPPAKIRKITSPMKTGSPVKDLNKSDDTDGETCPICLDTWGNSGDHRLVALKCGHLFGAQCVERWLKAQTSNHRTCPTCKSKAAMKDLRCIYARKLIAADNSEITRLQKQVDILQAEKSRTELKLQTATMTSRSLAKQLDDLRKTMAKSQSQSLVSKQEDKKLYRFALEKNLEISREPACRVMDYNCRTYDLCVSQKSTNNLFPGYGIRKVSMVDYTLGQFIHLHPKPIRDVKYSQRNDLLLSVSLDKTARIVERGISNMTLQAGFPLWSCAWDHSQVNEFYVGGVGGEIHHYDLRFMGTVLYTASSNVDLSPVVSLASTEFGLLSCQLNSCRLWEFIEGSWVPKLFPVTGSFVSMYYDEETQKALVSMRPRSAERSKLTMCSLKPTPQGGAFIEVDNFITGSARTSLMSRAIICKAESSSWIAAYSESDTTLYLHGLEGARSMSLPAADPALDLCSLRINSLNLLAALSESRLRIYKAVKC